MPSPKPSPFTALVDWIVHWRSCSTSTKQANAEVVCVMCSGRIADTAAKERALIQDYMYKPTVVMHDYIKLEETTHLHARETKQFCYFCRRLGARQVLLVGEHAKSSTLQQW